MYKIVMDSCGELTEDMKKDGHYCSVPLELDIDGYRILDDETFDQKDFLERVKKSSHSPKSSCPSPDCYMKAYEGEAERVYVVTLSGQLSGSYGSAVLASQLYEEEHEQPKQIHVFNSKSASVGETLIGIKIQELEAQNKSFEEVVAGVEEYIASENTFFVLETLESLRKAGRLNNFKAVVASTLNIKPVMGSTPEGTIQQLGQARGMKKALSKLVETMVAATKNCEQKVLGISHCNCPERAQFVKELIEKAANFKQILVVDTAGVSSMYANDGGIIIAV
ncbi:MAG: DegV family protein [Lachnospiraceae bacterium]|nr:DegV family protein [Lachnospiraceae bacterium]